MVSSLPHHHVHNPLWSHFAEWPSRGHSRILPRAKDLFGRQDDFVNIADSNFGPEEEFNVVVAVWLEEGRGGGEEGIFDNIIDNPITGGHNVDLNDVDLNSVDRNSVDLNSIDRNNIDLNSVDLNNVDVNLNN